MLLVSQLNTNLGNGEISFSVVDGEPYVKVGADSPRPFKSYVYKEYVEENLTGKAYSIARTLDFSDVPNYNLLTVDNFKIIAFTSFYASGETSLSYTTQYDNTTGALTITMISSDGVLRLYAGNITGAVCMR